MIVQNFFCFVTHRKPYRCVDNGFVIGNYIIVCTVPLIPARSRNAYLITCSKHTYISIIAVLRLQNVVSKTLSRCKEIVWVSSQWAWPYRGLVCLCRPSRHLSALFTMRWPRGSTLSLSPCPPFEMIFALHRSTFRLTQRQRTLHTCASLESLAILNINASIISVVPKELRSAGPQSSVSYVFFPMAKRLSKSIVRRAVKQLSV